MEFAHDPEVGDALVRLQRDAERHVRAIGRLAERHLTSPESCEEAFGRVCVASAIRSGLLLQRAIATALELSPDYVVTSPFALAADDGEGSHRTLELDIAAYRRSDRTLYVIEVVRTYSNVAHSRRKALKHRLIEAALLAPGWTRAQGLDCDVVRPAIVTREAGQLVPPANVDLITLDRFSETFGTSARGTVHAALSHFMAGLHACLAELGY